MANDHTMPEFSAAQLTEALATFTPILERSAPRPFAQPYPAEQVISAFVELGSVFSAAKQVGGLLNPWLLAGLRRDELRNAQALAGLWMTDFGGETSLRFLATFLQSAFPNVDWSKELACGYRVETELCPVGSRSDRVDLVIESQKHIVGIEIKIGAGLGDQQLERYVKALATRGRWRRATPHLILLAPFEKKIEGVVHRSWADVSRAAYASVGTRSEQRSIPEYLITSFGDHVKAF